LRRCYHCGSIGLDDERVCGVCGSSLAETTPISLEEAEKIKDPPFQIKWRVSRTGIAGLIVGVVLTAGGGLLLGFRLIGSDGIDLPVGFWGILMVATGIIFIASGIDTITGKVLRPSGGGRHGGFGPSGRAVMEKEADREEQEERDRESGAAD
jgi:hypothetical protein